jgi:hypothetical protein
MIPQIGIDKLCSISCGANRSPMRYLATDMASSVIPSSTFGWFIFSIVSCSQRAWSDRVPVDRYEAAS